MATTTDNLKLGPFGDDQELTALYFMLEQVQQARAAANREILFKRIAEEAAKMAGADTKAVRRALGMP